MRQFPGGFVICCQSVGFVRPRKAGGCGFDSVEPLGALLRNHALLIWTGLKREGIIAYEGTGRRLAEVSGGENTSVVGSVV